MNDSPIMFAIGVSASLKRSQILTPFSVPTAIHYIFGLKAMALIIPPVSYELFGASKSLKFQIFNVESLPPVAR